MLHDPPGKAPQPKKKQPKKKKQVKARQPKKKRGPLNKKPASLYLAFHVLGFNTSDEDGAGDDAHDDDGSTGFHNADALNVDALFPDDCSTDSASGSIDDVAEGVVDEDFDPLLEVIKMIIAQLSTEELNELLDNWRLLAAASEKKPLPVGSGCTGSGMDYHVVKLVSEVLVTFIYKL